jgi:hypothetical protein
MPHQKLHIPLCLGLQVALLTTATMGPVNSFAVTFDGTAQYASIACNPYSVDSNLDINYFAKVIANLSSPAGQFLKAVVKCTCGPGYQGVTPAANYTSSSASPTGSAGLTCTPCGAGWYRWAMLESSSIDNHITTF